MARGRWWWCGGLLFALLLLLGGCSDADAEEDGLKGVRPIKYGEAPSQIGELSVPNAFGPHPVVVLIHGGWWRADDFDRGPMRALVRSLNRAGFATWNLEYRLVGEEGGGWPGTFQDIALGIDELARLAPENNLDLNRVVVLGHSAGGHLALWAGARDGLPAGIVGSDPEVVPVGIVALAPVADLVAAAHEGMGAGAVVEFLGGGPDERQDVYALASPQHLLPLGVPHLLVHGAADDVVPVHQSEAYLLAATDAGDAVEMLFLDDLGHFEVIDPDSEVWGMVLERLPELAEPRPHAEVD